MKSIPETRRAGRFCVRPAYVERACSVGGLVLDEVGLELLHRRVRIDAGLLDVVGPGLLERRGGLLPFAKLRWSELVDLVAGLSLDLGDAGVFEVGPGTRDLQRPLDGAVVVDRLLLLRRHRVVGVLVENEGESDREE